VIIVAVDVLLLLVLMATCPFWVEPVGQHVERALRDLRELVSRKRS